MVEAFIIGVDSAWVYASCTQYLEYETPVDSELSREEKMGHTKRTQMSCLREHT